MTRTNVHGFACESYIFDPRPTYPLVSTVKRYWKPDSPYLDDPKALTLVFAHGTSFCKEMWEPVLEELGELLEGAGRGGHGNRGNGEGKRGKGKKVKIREMWTIDAPNHGDAAAINEETLKLGYGDVFAWEEYGRSVHLFISGLGKGVDVDFRKHNVVGIGHSMGAVAMALSLGYYPKINFTALVLCEIMTLPPAYGKKAKEMLVGGAEKRRERWPSRDEAYKMLKARGTWKAWDDRALRSYVEYGMRECPTEEEPKGVTLSCSKEQEVACYRDLVGSQRVYANLGNIVRQVPTHMIYGTIDDYIAPEVKKDIVERVIGGVQNLASFARVEGSGHLMKPKGLAEKLYDALAVTRVKEAPRANL